MMGRYSHTRNERKREDIAAAFSKKAVATQSDDEKIASAEDSPHFHLHSESAEVIKSFKL